MRLESVGVESVCTVEQRMCLLPRTDQVFSRRYAEIVDTRKENFPLKKTTSPVSIREKRLPSQCNSLSHASASFGIQKHLLDTVGFGTASNAELNLAAQFCTR
jgi:hypothetical protein